MEFGTIERELFIEASPEVVFARLQRIKTIAEAAERRRTR
jgi:hypothetical protein